MNERDSVGKRIKRFFVLMGSISAITAGVVIAQRLSNDALALLIGLVAGVAVMVPSLLLLGFLWHRQETRTEAAWRGAATPPPSVVVVAPPMLPSYGTQRPALWDAGAASWPMVQAERKFTIVGDE
ncbi:MAG: hypothetical protein RBT47_05735 [Anaerolineae bacterium]|jgi:hypothetical protein|nr:hypothetical protein [Anaerolineae bacterium]